MNNRLGQLTGRWFRDRQLLIRSERGVSYVHIRRHHQLLTVGVAVGLLVWGTVTSTALVMAGGHIEDQSVQIRDLEIGYADLITNRSYRTEAVEAVTDHLEPDTGVGRQIVAQNAELREEIAHLQAQLGDEEARHQDTEAARLALLAEIDQLTATIDLAMAEREQLEQGIHGLQLTVAAQEDANTRLRRQSDGQRGEIVTLSRTLDNAEAWNSTLESQIEELSAAVQQAFATIDQVADERDRLRAAVDVRDLRIAEADTRTAELEDLLRHAQLAAVNLSTARDQLADRNGTLVGQVDRLNRDLTQLETSQESLFAELRARSEAYVVDVEEGLSYTGLDVDGLIEQLQEDIQPARGGPMLPVIPNALLDSSGWSDADDLIDAVDRAAELRDVVNRLPISMPIFDDFRVTSGFGVRRDPFTGRPARHTGQDFAAPMRTSVFSTAPGDVTFAGRRGAYGNMVEIDHGLGLKSRYAHLNAILVEEGDRVLTGQEIGLVGNTGRSTGPHLHYEIWVDGAPRNPNDFLRAGQHVFQDADQ